jgi:hypothetical protein
MVSAVGVGFSGEIAIRYASRARIRHDSGDLATAEADVQRAIAWAEAQTPRDEPSLAARCALRASIRQDRGDLTKVKADIQPIEFGEAQTPHYDFDLASWYESRASIRRQLGDLTGAEADVQWSISWEEAQIASNRRYLTIRDALRAQVWSDRGIEAKSDADFEQASVLFDAARIDIDRAAERCEINLPADGRTIESMRQLRASVDAQSSTLGPQ